ncbi:MAG TPA: hypothetical protein VK174_11285, partial [Chitinophagales bacterium]|nr:hypothetical protein [Chitinophagales bacterium]
YIDMGTTKMESVPFAFHAATGGTPQIQSDWMQSNVSALDFIKNKPTILSGSGSANYLPKWTAPNTLSSTSAIYNDANDNIGVGTSVVAAKLHVAQSANAIGLYVTGGGNDLDIARFKRDIGATGVIGVKSPGSNPQMYFDREVANGTWAMGVRNISGDQSFAISGNNSIGTADRLVINRSDGSVTLSSLAGSGIRPVYADDNGKLRASITTWQLIDASDFQTGDDNWIAAEGNYTGTSGTAIRALTAIASASTTNYGLISSGTNNVAFQKTIDLTNVPHTQVMVRFHYYCFDSWEQWERGILNASGDGTTFTTIWAKPWWVSWSQYHFFGNSIHFDHEFENEIAIYNHTSNSLVLRFTNTQGASLTSEESFGIDNIEIYVR